MNNVSATWHVEVGRCCPKRTEKPPRLGDFAAPMTHVIRSRGGRGIRNLGKVQDKQLPPTRCGRPDEISDV